MKDLRRKRLAKSDRREKEREKREGHYSLILCLSMATDQVTEAGIQNGPDV